MTFSEATYSDVWQGDVSKGQHSLNSSLLFQMKGRCEDLFAILKEKKKQIVDSWSEMLSPI